ncbi:hypothetical protein Ahy_B01g055999 [Arachis hypogaea]|uniref:Pentatricopeptide repeat-containing protein n=1 Tax=Arachis hypogaea TaxID=3818 RepID=A0A445AXN4_ARAHY|nr:hypothetical protein Ahy_B01g055999 [Arachis hypogaea]
MPVSPEGDIVLSPTLNRDLVSSAELFSSAEFGGKEPRVLVWDFHYFASEGYRYYKIVLHIYDIFNYLLPRLADYHPSNAIKMTTTTDATAAASSEAQLLKTVTTILTSHPDPHSALKLLIQNLTLPTVLSVLSTTQLHRTHSATLLSFFHIFRHSLHPSLSSSPEPLLALLPGLLVHRRYSSARSLLLNFISSDHPRHSLHQLLFRRPRLPQPLLDTSLSAYTLSDHPDLAFQLFNKMKRLRIKPNLLTCHSLLSSLVRRHPHSSHSIHLSKQVFNDSLKLGITSNTTTFNILIHGSCLDNNFNNALSFMNQMTNFTCSPDNITYNTFLDA